MQTERHTHRTDIHTKRQTYKQKGIHTEQTDIQTDRHTHRTDIHRKRLTNRQTYSIVFAFKFELKHVSCSGFSEEQVLHIAGPLDPEEGVGGQRSHQGEGDAQAYQQYLAHSCNK